MHGPRCRSGGHAGLLARADDRAFARRAIRRRAPSDYPIYSRVAALVLLGVSAIIASANLDSWTILRFAGSRAMDISHMYHDPVFGKSAAFYLFDLPFWADMRGYVFAVVILAILVYLLVGTRLAVAIHAAGFRPAGSRSVVPETGRRPRIGVPARRAAFFLLAIACRYYLDRFAMAWNQHKFLTGIDYTDDHFVSAAQLAGDCRADRGRGAGGRQSDGSPRAR